MKPVFYVIWKSFLPAAVGLLFGMIVLVSTGPFAASVPLASKDTVYIIATLLIAVGTGIPMLVFVATLYLLPTIAAKGYRHRNERAIFALNVLLGWTFIGWALALVWALTDDPSPSPVPMPHSEPATVAASADDEEELIGVKFARYIGNRIGRLWQR